MTCLGKAHEGYQQVKVTEDHLTLINLTKHQNPRELGLRISIDLGVKDEDPYETFSVVLCDGSGQISLLISPPALVGTSTNDSSINMIAEW
jgi:hypothetical protein